MISGRKKRDPKESVEKTDFSISRKKVCIKEGKGGQPGSLRGKEMPREKEKAFEEKRIKKKKEKKGGREK